MKYLSDKYISVYKHRGYDICTLKVAVPSDGDDLGYVVDSAHFKGQTFHGVADAVIAINKLTN